MFAGIYILSDINPVCRVASSRCSLFASVADSLRGCPLRCPRCNNGFGESHNTTGFFCQYMEKTGVFFADGSPSSPENAVPRPLFYPDCESVMVVRSKKKLRVYPARRDQNKLIVHRTARQDSDPPPLPCTCAFSDKKKCA